MKFSIVYRFFAITAFSTATFAQQAVPTYTVNPDGSVTITNTTTVTMTPGDFATYTANQKALAVQQQAALAAQQNNVTEINAAAAQATINAGAQIVR